MAENCLTGISPSERLGSMFENCLYSDCSFLIEGNEIRAHKLILATASPKMERMFLTDGAETNQVEVGYSMRAMQLILKHVYLQDMDIENIDEAQDVIEAAHFFEMTDLVELCCAGIEPETLEELWPALDLACAYDSRILKEACLSLALEYKDVLLDHERVREISAESLAFLLSREVIQVKSELQILEVAVEWAKRRVEDLDDPDVSVRTELESGDILKHIRIMSLVEDEFKEFVAGIGAEMFTGDEIEKLKEDYFKENCEQYVCPIRTERMLERKIPLCGTDYLAVNEENDRLSVKMKVFQLEDGTRPTIKSIVLPSQINPANILYDNVSHRTHYNECILVEISVADKIIARGSFRGRIKYSDDIYINLFTVNQAAMYIDKTDVTAKNHYQAQIKVMFRVQGYYPLAVEIKCDDDAPITLDEPCRFIHEFILTYPNI